MNTTPRQDRPVPLRVFSYGGGVQSTAALVLAAQGKIDFRWFVFANVGEDSEHPATLAYVRDVAIPFASLFGLRLETIKRERRNGESMTLYQHVMSDRFKGVQLPVRLAADAPARRHCTVSYKINVLAKWQREHGATVANPAIVGLGISWDELQRMRTSRDEDARVLVYPLVDMRLTRHDCEAIIRSAGLPLPRRSSCFFCPYHTRSQWQTMRHEEPDLFAKAVAMEAHMDTKMRAEGQGGVTMHSKGPLMTITSEARQMTMALEREDACESGYCMV